MTNLTNLRCLEPFFEPDESLPVCFINIYNGIGGGTCKNGNGGDFLSTVMEKLSRPIMLGVYQV